MAEIQIDDFKDSGKSKIALMFGISEEQLEAFLSRGINTFDGIKKELKKNKVVVKYPSYYKSHRGKATIATHHGHQVSIEHNLRNNKVVNKEAHIDPAGEHETWRNNGELNTYKELFEEAIQEHDKKEIRNARKEKSYKDYYYKIKKNKQKFTSYEMICGIYMLDENGKPVSSDLQKRVYKKFVEGWDKRNPNARAYCINYHADEEGQPHIHIDYVPFYHSKGKLKVKTGLRKAMEEMGFVQGKNGNMEYPITQWQRRENEVLEEIAKEMGFKVVHPEISAKKHISTIEFKARKNIIELTKKQEQLLEENQKLEKTIRNKKKFKEFEKKENKREKENAQESKN